MSLSHYVCFSRSTFLRGLLLGFAPHASHIGRESNTCPSLHLSSLPRRSYFSPLCPYVPLVVCVSGPSQRLSGMRTWQVLPRYRGVCLRGVTCCVWIYVGGLRDGGDAITYLPTTLLHHIYLPPLLSSAQPSPGQNKQIPPGGIRKYFSNVCHTYSRHKQGSARNERLMDWCTWMGT